MGVRVEAEVQPRLLADAVARAVRATVADPEVELPVHRDLDVAIVAWARAAAADVVIELHDGAPGEARVRVSVPATGSQAQAGSIDDLTVCLLAALRELR